MAKKTYAPGEVEARAEAYYREIMPQLDEPPEMGKFVVIDVESGDYEIDARDADATYRLLQRRPDGYTYAFRVGFPTAYRGGFVPGIRKR